VYRVQVAVGLVGWQFSFIGPGLVATMISTVTRDHTTVPKDFGPGHALISKEWTHSVREMAG